MEHKFHHFRSHLFFLFRSKNSNLTKWSFDTSISLHAEQIYRRKMSVCVEQISKNLMEFFSFLHFMCSSYLFHLYVFSLWVKSRNRKLVETFSPVFRFNFYWKRALWTFSALLEKSNSNYDLLDDDICSSRGKIFTKKLLKNWKKMVEW